MPGTPTTQPLRHSHRFDQGNPLAERNTRWAVLLTACMMVAEIAGGWLFNSMALLADGWHMSSHALALGLAVLAYELRGAMPTTRASASVRGRSRCSAATPAPCCFCWWPG